MIFFESLKVFFAEVFVCRDMTFGITTAQSRFNVETGRRILMSSNFPNGDKLDGRLEFSRNNIS